MVWMGGAFEAVSSYVEHAQRSDHDSLNGATTAQLVHAAGPEIVHLHYAVATALKMTLLRPDRKFVVADQDAVDRVAVAIVAAHHNEDPYRVLFLVACFAAFAIARCVRTSAGRKGGVDEEFVCLISPVLFPTENA